MTSRVVPDLVGDGIRSDLRHGIGEGEDGALAVVEDRTGMLPGGDVTTTRKTPWAMRSLECMSTQNPRR